jgi:hypothetical protein
MTRRTIARSKDQPPPSGVPAFVRKLRKIDGSEKLWRGDQPGANRENHYERDACAQPYARAHLALTSLTYPTASTHPLSPTFPGARFRNPGPTDEVGGRAR